MSYEYEVPHISPVPHEEIIRSIGHSGIQRIVKVTQPTPQEVDEMLQLAEELPN